MPFFCFIACLAILYWIPNIMNFILLGAGYFISLLLLLSFVPECREVSWNKWSFQVLLLRLVRWVWSSVQSEVTEYSSLLSQLLVLCLLPGNHKIFWLLGTGAIPGPVWAPLLLILLSTLPLASAGGLAGLWWWVLSWILEEDPLQIIGFCLGFLPLTVRYSQDVKTT